LHQHEAGSIESFTSGRLPVKFVFVMEFPTVHEALVAEKKVKDWSRAKKEALIRQDTKTLKLLSECRNPSHCRRLR
jgi:predicted GIY-YIG superfamily endonuclease